MDVEENASYDDWILFSNRRELLPIFHTNSPDGSHFTQMGSLFAQNTIPHPCPLFSSHILFLGICRYTKHPQPHPKFGPKTPLILAWTWTWIKWNTIWAIWTPTGQNDWKVSKTFLEVGKEIYSSSYAVRVPFIVELCREVVMRWADIKLCNTSGWMLCEMDYSITATICSGIDPQSSSSMTTIPGEFDVEFLAGKPSLHNMWVHCGMVCCNAMHMQSWEPVFIFLHVRWTSASCPVGNM